MAASFRATSTIAFAAWSIWCGAAASAGDLYVIGNGVPPLTAEDVKEIFLGEVQFSGAIKLVPVDNASAQSDFQARVLKMPPAKYSASWTKKAFRDGLNAPAVKSTDREVIRFVKATPGALSYVTTPPPDDVRLVGKF